MLFHHLDRIELAMVQQPSDPYDLHTDSDDHVGPLPTRFATELPAQATARLTEFPALLADRPATGSQVRVRAHAIRRVVVLEVAAPLSDVVLDLDLTIQLALADGPRGVVCDLTSVLAGAEPGAVEVLATAGRARSGLARCPCGRGLPGPAGPGGAGSSSLG
jgi:hypothetical protein